MADLPVPAAEADDARSIELIAAALRADSADIETLVRVLSSSLGESLPAGMVDVRWVRSLGDRLAGRDGVPVEVTVTTPDVRLHLTHGPGRGAAVRAEVQRTVRGVVISRQEVGVDTWIRTLAQALAGLAEQNADARQALNRLLAD